MYLSELSNLLICLFISQNSTQKDNQRKFNQCAVPQSKTKVLSVTLCNKVFYFSLQRRPIVLSERMCVFQTNSLMTRKEKLLNFFSMKSRKETLFQGYF